MHIVYIHQYFNTPQQEGSTRSYEFSKFLIGRGHKVTLITSGIKNDEFPCLEGRVYQEYDCEGIRLLSLNAGYHDGRYGTKLSGFERIRQFQNFAKAATQVGKELKSVDVVFATHTPLHVGLTGIALKRYHGCPFVFEVRDLWPDALINIGALKNPLAIWVLRRLERKIYRAADHIVALSPGMKAGVCAQGIPDEGVTIIPNASDLNMFHPDSGDPKHRERLGLGDRFAAIYFGAMGHANGLDYVVDAAQILKDRGERRVVFVLHGNGGHRNALESRVRSAQLDNVVFSDPMPAKSEIAKLVGSCQACMTIYRASRETTWSPNKMFDALAAGKPVLINVGGWLGETIAENGCGRALSADKPVELADAVTELVNNPALTAEMGKNSRRLAENEFAREKLAEKLESILTRTLANR